MSRKVILVVVVGVSLGVAVGVGGYTFAYAGGAAYLTNDPRACANCHIMTEQYEGWIRSSHGKVATCNDCHTPPRFFPKYLTKALNGFWHSYAFTTGDFHEPIRINARNRAVTEQACRGCHAQVTHMIDVEGSEAVSCMRCHNSVGHLESTPAGASISVNRSENDGR